MQHVTQSLAPSQPSESVLLRSNRASLPKAPAGKKPLAIPSPRVAPPQIPPPWHPSFPSPWHPGHPRNPRNQPFNPQNPNMPKTPFKR